jgi:hypothetical protein
MVRVVICVCWDLEMDGLLPRSNCKEGGVLGGLLAMSWIVMADLAVRSRIDVSHLSEPKLPEGSPNFAYDNFSWQIRIFCWFDRNCYGSGVNHFVITRVTCSSQNLVPGKFFTENANFCISLAVTDTVRSRIDFFTFVTQSGITFHESEFRIILAETLTIRS